MQKDVKIGIAIGVLLIALIGIFWWARGNKPPKNETLPGDSSALPPPVEPVAPSAGTPDVTVPGAVRPGAPGTVTTGTVMPGVVPPTTLPAPAMAKKYKVQAGDTLEKIARSQLGDGTKYKLIADANKIPPPYKLNIDQELIIPDVAGARPPEPPPTTGTTTAATKTAGEQKHTVAAGDTLIALSKKYYGTEAKFKVIADANHIAEPYTLKVGQVLVIPAAK